MMILDDEQEEEFCFLLGVLSHIPWVNNGPGVCVSKYSSIYFTRLLERPRNYTPCFLNPEMIEGDVSIQTHLVKRHHLSKRRVKKIKIDNCYRIHDLLHEREKQDVQRDNDRRKPRQRSRA